eukprot:TRINITY_DN538_c0_g3_i1.p1 TRINITY_DN538_c0_g3~~TRINITY_DN538_c0_g3_i1.p1  ORF type:complete len:414 (+),score=135.02 TRINITY_DN538_c0_g3_i1:75-1244(+)
MRSRGGAVRAAVLGALLPALRAAAAPCSSDADCHMAGRCAAGSCRCEKGWGGPDCGQLQLGGSGRCGTWGLCMHGEMDNVATWGGEAVQGDDGKWHLYVAAFPNSTLDSWLWKSRVLHAVADAPQGPYVGKDYALGPRGPRTDSYWDSLTQHNPAVQRAPDGTYLLYYMGDSQHANSSADTFDCHSGAENQPACMQRVGLATAPSPEGPWKRRDAPILPPGPPGQWDDLFTTNPTPHVFPNGSVLLVYKARSLEDQSVMSTGAAFAEHWEGPYVRRGGKISSLSAICEDAGIYYSPTMEVFRMILHCGCNYKYVWSRNGIDWHGTTPEIPWCNISFTDGTTGKVGRRERPKWVIGADGHPTHLLTAVQPIEAVDPVHGKNTWTLATAVL